MVPLFTATDWNALFGERYAKAAQYGQVAALIMLVAAIMALWSKRGSIVRTSAFKVAGPFVAVCVASLVWSINPSKTGFNCLLLVIYLSMAIVFWQTTDVLRKRTSLFSAVAILFTMAMLPVVLPYHARSFGAVTPNLLAHYAMASMILLMINGRYRIPAAVMGLAIIGMTQARTVMIEYIIFWLMYLFALPWVHRRNSIVRATGVLIGGGAIAAALYKYALPFVIANVSALLGVHEESRLGTDFTGRGVIWQSALTVMRRHLPLGYGFRTRIIAELDNIDLTINAHSGLLNVILDVGLVGLACYVFWYAYSMFSAFSGSLHPFPEERRTIAAFLVANIPVQMLEPNYISFAHPTSFMTLLGLAYGFVRFKPDTPVAAEVSSDGLIADIPEYRGILAQQSPIRKAS
jgi:hypothetical protein